MSILSEWNKMEDQFKVYILQSAHTFIVPKIYGLLLGYLEVHQNAHTLIVPNVYGLLLGWFELHQSAHTLTAPKVLGWFGVQVLQIEHSFIVLRFISGYV